LVVDNQFGRSATNYGRRLRPPSPRRAADLIGRLHVPIESPQPLPFSIAAKPTPRRLVPIRQSIVFHDAGPRCLPTLVFLGRSNLCPSCDPKTQFRLTETPTRRPEIATASYGGRRRTHSSRSSLRQGDKETSRFETKSSRRKKNSRCRGLAIYIYIYIYIRACVHTVSGGQRTRRSADFSTDEIPRVCGDLTSSNGRKSENRFSRLSAAGGMHSTE